MKLYGSKEDSDSHKVDYLCSWHSRDAVVTDRCFEQMN